MKTTQHALSALILVLCACVQGCANVAPWERGNLAKPHMALNPEPMQSALRTHLYGSREASTGGGAASGGGCGCY